MEKNANQFVIENDLRPAYYDDFHCLMGDCRQSCCRAAWRIAFDKKDYLKIKQQGSAELNEKLEHCLHRIRGKGEQNYAEFVTGGVVCPLLDENCLCSLQREKGYDVLPLVCRVFPRREGPVLSGYFERSLSPACEGVLALLWDLPEGVVFRSDPLEKKGTGQLRSGVEDTALIRGFQEIRSLCIDFLQDRRRPLPQRILAMGLALQELADGGDVPRFLQRRQAILTQEDEPSPTADDPRALELSLLNNVKLFLSLHREGRDVQAMLGDMARWLSLEGENGQYRVRREAYLEARARYEERFQGREYFMENLMVSLFFYLALPDVKSPEGLWRSYVNFCNLYAAYRFAAVMSCREGASGDREELFRLVVLVSRALLHSQTNQDALRDGLFQHESASLAHMAVLLCG